MPEIDIAKFDETTRTELEAAVFRRLVSHLRNRPDVRAAQQDLAQALAAVAGMVFGSLAPQWLPDHKDHVHHYEGSATA